MLIEYLPAPYPSISLEIPQIYSQLRSAAPGSVIELPMGLRDGFGHVGMFDDRTLLYQTQHGHPLVGGFAARIPESIRARYESLPVVRSLLRCSESTGCEPASEDQTLSKAEAASALRSVRRTLRGDRPRTGNFRAHRVRREGAATEVAGVRRRA